MSKHIIRLAVGIALYYGSHRLDQYAIRIWDGGINTLPTNNRAHVSNENDLYEDPAIMAQRPEGKRAIWRANRLADLAQLIRDCSRIVIAIGLVPIVILSARRAFSRHTNPKEPPCDSADESSSSASAASEPPSES